MSRQYVTHEKRDPLSSQCLLDQGVDRSKWSLFQLVPFGQILRRIVAEPDLAVSRLPDEGFQGQIDRYRGMGVHQWSTGFRITKNQEFRGPHLQANLGGLGLLVDPGKDFYSFRLE